jgi:hypothetical protein
MHKGDDRESPVSDVLLADGSSSKDFAYEIRLQ